MSRPVQNRLGPYELQSRLGSGGMGDVFRARDTRLNRDVAVKVLPKAFAAEADRVRRFEQEAKLLAALNHPSVLTIYDAGVHEDSPYLVSELLEGRTLRDELSHGPLSLRKTTDYALQIASGLAAAHARGIVHRDLKPENLFITKEGRVKILDFGLAKLRDANPKRERHASEAATDPAAPTAMQSTEPGLVLGTVGYMSPEQVRGEESDHRSDLFTFGAILYEMLVGQRAFRGDTPVETMNAILNSESLEFTSATPTVPPALERIVHRCLEKLPERRFQSASDLGFALESVSTISTSVRLKNGQMPSWKFRLLKQAGASALLVSLGAGFVWFFRPAARSPSPPQARFEIEIPRGERLAHSFGHGLAFSPDGQTLAFVSSAGSNLFSDVAGNHIWMRRMDQVEARAVAGTGGALEPVFSPDGQWLAWTVVEGDATSLKKIPTGGGEVVTLFKSVAKNSSGDADTGSELGRYGLSWNSDGTIILGGQRGGLLRVPATGGVPETITKLDESAGEVSHRLPHVLPDGRSILFTAVRHRLVRLLWNEMDVFVTSLETGKGTLLIKGATDARYVSPGYLAFVREGQLFTVSFDATKRRVTGPEILLQDNVNQALYGGNFVSDSGAAQFTFSTSGTLAYAAGSVLPEVLQRVVWVDQQGIEEPIPVEPKSYQSVRVSPKGDQLLMTSIYSPNSAVWIYDLARGTLRRQTFEGRSSFAVWGPGEDNFTFDWSRKGITELYSKRVNSAPTDAEKLNIKTLTYQRPGAWSPDAKWFAYVTITADPSVDIWLKPADRDALPFLNSRFDESFPDFSPDGKWLAYSSSESGRSEIYMRSLTNPVPAIQVSTTGGMAPVWSRDGRKIFFVTSEGQNARVFFAASIDLQGERVKITTPVKLFRGNYSMASPSRSWDVAPDGRCVLCKPLSEESYQAAFRRIFPERIQIVQNWFQAFRGK